eukprot:6174445-Pleurochrysis_carterae.AAC.1
MELLETAGVAGELVSDCSAHSTSVVPALHKCVYSVKRKGIVQLKVGSKVGSHKGQEADDNQKCEACVL